MRIERENLEFDAGRVNKAYVNDKDGENWNNIKTPIPTAAVKDEADGVEVFDFDGILPILGEFGSYQIFLFLCMIPFAINMSFVYFGQIFLTHTPNHWCHIPELDALTMDERLALSIPKENGEYSSCRMYAVNYTELLAQNIKVANKSWPTIACQNGWLYDDSEIPYTTVATEQNWVCEDSALPTYAQSIFFLGAIFGGLLFGWIADRFGRIPALVGCNLMGFAGGVGTMFSNTFGQFALMRFFVGFAFDNCFTMMYILVLEYVGPKYRTFVANMSIAIFFTAATCALPWIAYFLADWKLLALVTSLPLAIAIFTPLVVPESARWLVSQGKIDKAIKLLRNLAKRNGKNVSDSIFERFEKHCRALQEEERDTARYSVLDLFKTPRLRRITILMVIIWMSISLVFDGHVRNVGSLGLNLFITFTVASFTELPANICLILTLDRWGRRWMAFGTMALSGVFCLIAAAVPIGLPSASMAICGRFFINITYNIGLQYAAEILPTVVRAQGVAFVHIMGYVASIVAPFVVYLGNVWIILPLIILGIMGIGCGTLCLFVPETLNEALPETLTDGEEFGKNQKFWNFPCCGHPVDDLDDVEKRKSDFVRAHPTRQSGASLGARSIGEMRSSAIQRSIRSRHTSRL